MRSWTGEQYVSLLHYCPTKFTTQRAEGALIRHVTFVDHMVLSSQKKPTKQKYQNWKKSICQVNWYSWAEIFKKAGKGLVSGGIVQNTRTSSITMQRLNHEWEIYNINKTGTVTKMSKTKLVYLLKYLVKWPFSPY